MSHRCLAIFLWNHIVGQRHLCHPEGAQRVKDLPKTLESLGGLNLRWQCWRRWKILQSLRSVRMTCAFGVMTYDYVALRSGAVHLGAFEI